MEPKVLADALVDAGILKQWAEDKRRGLYVLRRGLYVLPGHYQTGGHDVKGAARWAITDWRVAGKVLESIYDGPLVIQIFMNDVIKLTAKGADLPRSIIKAWYEATEQVEGDARGWENETPDESYHDYE